MSRYDNKMHRWHHCGDGVGVSVCVYDGGGSGGGVGIVMGVDACVDLTMRSGYSQVHRYFCVCTSYSIKVPYMWLYGVLWSLKGSIFYFYSFY